MNFDHRVALITGGTGGLGSAVTGAFLKNGAQVVTTFHSEAGFQELQNSVGAEKTRLTGIRADVTKAAEVQNLVAQTLAQCGRIDILINLVGGYAGGVNVADLPEADWDRMLNLNLKSAFLVCKAVLPQMLQNNYGRLVNTASRGAVEVGAGVSAYAVSKAGVLTLTKALAQEVKGKNITANVVLPGMIDTPVNRQAMPQAMHSKFVRPESIAQTVLFLASEEARDLNGAAVPIYGGS
jgi:NAD(P)-dependent dehydrogenase (short-subunit alcohol dehydrogenase family)